MTNPAPRTSQFTRFALVIALGAVAAASALTGAKAQEATYAQRMACTPDAWRLCSSEIPDVSAVKACMIVHKAQLSSGCRAMFGKTVASR